MFFKKKETIKSYIIKDLNERIERYIRDCNIDLNNPLAGMHVQKFINHMRNSYNQSERLLAIKYSTSIEEASSQVYEALQEVTNNWLK